MNNKKTEKSKNARGFYVTLGISALMIGSACYFSYKEGDSKYDNPSSSSQYAVDRKETNIPKATTSRKHSYVTVTTTLKTNEDVNILPVTSEEISESISEPVPEITSEPDNSDKDNINVIYEPPVEEVAVEPEKPDKINQPLKSPLNIINEFSGQELVKNPTTGSWQTHNGTDYKAEIGDDVYSVIDGNITAVNNDPLWGTTVVIQDSNGDIYRYCNLAKDLNVQQGTSICAGDVIGSVGDTADIESAIEPHLHIEVLRGGKYVNPADFIK
ncbi:MAG: M23 family metallopeptidase [Oscillospiraceae bacterium]|nr:M23 family metallopeptidase [Oscillospiraceae bacterium]